MNRYRKWLALLLIVLAIVMNVGALAEEISTTVVMRASRMVQSAIVNVGEDLTLEIGIEGVEPASYQWYYENELIPGAEQRIYTIVNAQPSDSGLYRLDAFDADGKMLVSMEISARVIEDVIPKSGDASRPIGVAALAFVLAAGVLLLTLGRRTEA